MVKQLVLRSPSGKTIIAPAYFASAKYGTLLGENQKSVDWRSPKAIHFKRHRQWTLESTDIFHLLKVAADIPTPTIAPDSLSLETANPLTIDGQGVQAGDRVEIRSTEATALRISPGIWTASSDRRLVLTNPPTYQLSSAWNLGTPWSFRVLSNGNLQGLAPLTRTNVTATQSTSSAVGNPNRFGGGLWNNVNMTNSSFQGFTIKFDALSVRRMALRVTSQKQSYDNAFPSATFGWNSSGVGMGSLFYDYESGAQQVNGPATYSLGQEQFWVSLAFDPAKNFSTFTVGDQGMSRAILAAEMYGDLPCQIRIGNEVPTNGSTLIIPESIADDFFPEIDSGSYKVINNDGLSPWILARS